MALTFDRKSLSLFGVDLAAVPRYLRQGWAEALRWPAFRWLSPDDPIRVIHADGTESVRLGLSSQPCATNGRARFTAIELADDVLLRRSLSLPPLPDEEVRQAVELDVQAANPFADDELVWAYVTEHNDRVRADIALTSRRLVERQLDFHRERLDGALPEVWVGGVRPFLIAGYGERPRLARVRRMRIAVIVLVASAIVLLAALAVTPTVQLREKALEAARRHGEMTLLVKPQSQMRDELATLGDQIRMLSSASAKAPDVVALLDEVTRQLPDDAVLSRLEVSGSTVRISGQADNAAQLLQTLGANPAFRDVRAPTGIARAPAGGKEGFAIEFQVGRKDKTQ